MKITKYDFGGYATKNDLKCSDGRIITRDAFKHQDGAKVPLVWQHVSDSPDNVLGHAVLENRKDGVYCYGFFNSSQTAQNAKEAVRHGDITSLSISAGQLQQSANSVLHGSIREVSLVYAGANPGARIDNLSFSHGDGTYTEDDTEAIIHSGLDIEFEHSEDAGEESDENAKIFESMTEEQQNLLMQMVQHASGEELEHSDDDSLASIFETMNDQQKQLTYYLVSEALATAEDNSTNHSDDNNDENYEGEEEMKHNAFDKYSKDGDAKQATTLTHAQVAEIIGDAKKFGGSLKESFLAHAVDYGFDPIDVLFPDAQMVRPGGPDTIKRDDSWVAGVLAETNHTPFSRIKTRTADLTGDEARAKGYITGNKKTEEVIPLLKRITTPTTIYKKQKLDRDDVVDITDFDVVVWLKNEMRGMLNEELARAVLIGDGRSIGDENKINEQNIRPIVSDDPDVFVHHQIVPATATTTDDIIDEVIKSREFYRGSGSPKLYTTTGLITDMLLIKDGMGRRIYSNEMELTSLLRVSKMVEVEAMNNATTVIKGKTYDVLGIIVNLKDYTIGADKGGAVSMFDDFDIDYNQQKYLIETRCSGALTMPKSAIILLKEHAAG